MGLIIDGQISEVGSYEELKEAKGAFSILLQEHILQTVDEDKKVEDDTTMKGDTKHLLLEKGISLEKGGELIQEEVAAKGNVSLSKTTF